MEPINLKRPFIIGIGGVSNSGKSRISNKIRGIFSDHKVFTIHQDYFVKPEQQIPKIQDKTDWECPESIDFEKFRQEILDQARKNEVVIAEGLLVFFNESVNELFDARIFVEIPKHVFLLRKSRDLRWGKEPPWYIDHIWESFLRYGYRNVDKTDMLVIRGDRKVSDQVRLFLLKKSQE